ncbi:hypothetical protein GWK47_007634 [Chionoecetes opilio]|uniref:Uncharacterized protein n=1 Tax=Chionoecetes opilio TaxID=41210 RepID=A0A8J5CQ59_CHIOP|nr:hypothetical protein GWK47_007634 [Chionoecetes opilio]
MLPVRFPPWVTLQAWKPQSPCPVSLCSVLMGVFLCSTEEEHQSLHLACHVAVGFAARTSSLLEVKVGQPRFLSEVSVTRTHPTSCARRRQSGPMGFLKVTRSEQ